MPSFWTFFFLKIKKFEANAPIMLAIAVTIVTIADIIGLIMSAGVSLAKLQNMANFIQRNKKVLHNISGMSE